MDTSMDELEGLAGIRRPKVIKVATLVTIVMTFIMLGVGGMAMYWSFTGKDVLTFNKDPFPVKPKFLKSEEFIALDADFCKVTTVTGQTTAVMVSDKTRIGIFMRPENLAKGCYHFRLDAKPEQQFRIPIPPQTPPDTYHIEFRQIYRTNPFHTITETVNSENFQIIE